MFKVSVTMAFGGFVFSGITVNCRNSDISFAGVVVGAVGLLGLIISITSLVWIIL
jgi:hypothetical protein